MRVLVTGGAGFIGSHVCDLLVASGHQVYVLDNLDLQVHPTGDWPDYRTDGATYMRGDVREPADVRMALSISDPEAVVHLAAKVGVGQSMYDIAEYTAVNVQGTAVLLEEIQRTRAGCEPRNPSRLVVASSMSIYGEGAYHLPEYAEGYIGTARLVPKPTPETHPLRPASIYAVNKRDQEEMCLIFGRAYGIPTTALRFFNTYGPRQKLGNPYTGAIAIFASRLLAGKPPIIFGSGQQTRDFTHVSDVARAVLYAVEPLRDNDPSGMAINIGTGRAVSVSYVADLLRRELVLSEELAPIHERERAGDVQHCYADAHTAMIKLGWKARYSLEDGIREREFIDWLIDQGDIGIEDGVDGATDLLKRHGLLA